MNKIYTRGRQFVFSRALMLIPTHEPQLIKGSGTLLQIPQLLKDAQTKKVIVMTTAGFVRRGTLQPLFDKLQSHGIAYTLFPHVMPDPTIACIEEAVEAYRRNACEAIIAIGGGSVMDCSKVLAARIARPEKPAGQMAGMFKIRATLPAIYAVPTTAGTSSEVTAGAVITDEKTHYKFTILDLCI